MMKQSAGLVLTTLNGFVIGVDHIKRRFFTVGAVWDDDI